MPSSTIPASSGRVQAAHGCLRRTVLEGVQRAERLMRMPPRTRVDSSSLRQGGWVVDIAEGDSEDDGEDPGPDAKVCVSVDTVTSPVQMESIDNDEQLLVRPSPPPTDVIEAMERDLLHVPSCFGARGRRHLCH